MTEASVPREPDPQPFDLAVDLPGAITVLEASAGTGKTHAISSLAVRYLADGVSIDRLLVVTFTRAATGELRARVRERLAKAEAALRGAQPGDGDPDDQLLALLTRGSEDDIQRRHRALVDALSAFDSATIDTIHGFCDQLLGSLGVAADSGRDLRFVEDYRDFVDAAADDLFLGRFVNDESQDLPFEHADARSIARAVIYNRDARIEPIAPEDDRSRRRAKFGRVARAEVLRRVSAAGLIGYDDQLHRVRDSLIAGTPSSAAAVARVRQRYSVVLVDEFQDTDPVQWDIFRTAFAGAGIPLLLIGDPKQAIYSFRGADVYAYLNAVDQASGRFTLNVNWRSDQPLLDALDALLKGSLLGDPRIPYRTVTAAPGHETSGISGGPEDADGARAPLRVRFVHRGDGLVRVTAAKRTAQADSARQVIAEDLADDVVRLLDSGVTLRRPTGDPTPVAPADIAVLVGQNRGAAIVQSALEEVGVPAVIAAGGTVLATPAARAWLTLLEALERPANTMRARAAALTPLIRWTQPQLDRATEAEVDDLQSDLHRWAAVLVTQGVAALAQTVASEVNLVAGELAALGGERRLTDLRHVAELLHAEALASGSGTRALAAWLRARMSEADSDTGVEERSRRLESDAAAVQIQTIHRSKGLEFPIVYLPYLWTGTNPRRGFPVFHDRDNQNQRAVDVGEKDSPGFGRHNTWADAEELSEDLREAYVGLTRARHRVVAWWITGDRVDTSQLARVAFPRQVEPPAYRCPAQLVKGGRDDDALLAAWQEIAARTPGLISIERVAAPTLNRWPGRPAAPADLQVATFTRSLDSTWRRSSFTALTQAAHDAHVEALVTSEPEDAGVTDEPRLSDADGASGEGGRAGPPAAGAPAGADHRRGELQAVSSPMAGLPAGAGFGIAVHSVLERVDFAADDLEGSLADLTSEAESIAAAGNPDPGLLASGLAAVINTPLGPLAGGLRLRDVPRHDRLDEVHFELPLAGGESPSGHLAVADIAECLRRWIPPGDLLSSYPDRLDDPLVGQLLRGYLTGGIDLALRVHAEPGPRHFVVDYKTNWLGGSDEPLSAWHYRPDRLAEEMAAEHYPLQALLYLVALHRYLRWRLAGYDPETHLGGALYLFVRGMSGPDTPTFDGTPAGVFAWPTPAGLVVELSDLFDTGGAGLFDTGGAGS